MVLGIKLELLDKGEMRFEIWIGGSGFGFKGVSNFLS